jgi:hypothetical protein
VKNNIEIEKRSHCCCLVGCCYFVVKELTGKKPKKSKKNHKETRNKHTQGDQKKESKRLDHSFDKIGKPTRTDFVVVVVDKTNSKKQTKNGSVSCCDTTRDERLDLL